ncbi:MAG: hypothetical protein WC449_06315 [Candidatus Paceibacterota bacterium]
MNTTAIRRSICAKAHLYKGDKKEQAARIVGEIRTREHRRFGRFLEDNKGKESCK